MAKKKRITLDDKVQRAVEILDSYRFSMMELAGYAIELREAITGLVKRNKHLKRELKQYKEQWENHLCL